MPDRTSFTAQIVAAAQKYQLPANLLEAQVLVESAGDPFAFRSEPAFYRTYIRGNPHAIGHDYGPLAACSYGLLQVMLETAMEHGFTGRPETLFDPQVSLDIGCDILNRSWGILGRNLDLYRQVLAAYNGGPALLHKSSPFDWPLQPRNYVSRIYALAGIQ